MANASLEDCQLFAQSEILQRDLFIAAKDQEDHPKKREDCVQHEAESVSASSLKINRFRNRWNSGEAQVHGCKQLGMKSGSTFAQALARGQFIRAIKGEVRNAIEIREAIEGSATQRVKHEVVDKPRTLEEILEASYKDE